ncbi:hypothetical protein CDAR_181391 [Caerostris darwini]|uniref:Uncharacterized protein n=1 Tax=Caerostris darwini TaxID=1538125 RepID=A0AAV4U423_9ARAC|nr:hypothetical protein CDAR_181391 [Caerostris darwini]
MCDLGPITRLSHRLLICKTKRLRNSNNQEFTILKCDFASSFAETTSRQFPQKLTIFSCYLLIGSIVSESEHSGLPPKDPRTVKHGFFRLPLRVSWTFLCLIRGTPLAVLENDTTLRGIKRDL